MITDAIIEERKERICCLIDSLERVGTGQLINYLVNNQFFEAPSSLNRHHNWRGGLAEHSLGVMRRALKMNTTESLKDSIIVAALLHDICKTRQFFYDDRGRIHKRKLYIKGHGYRSIKILEEIGFPLKEEERLAIRWHMGNWPKEPDLRKDREKAERCELWKLIHQADIKDARFSKIRHWLR